MGCGFSSPSDQVLVEPPSPPSKQPIKATVHGRQSESPVYTSLPKGTQKFPVRNVYDGDTLTLVDERRVRFLGIDTPELKEKQAFAQEAKDYAKQYCHKKDIYLLIDGTDHYGRLLAHIFVPYGGGYLCVNEGLVQEGLAYAYIPNKDEKKFNWTKILALQTEARTSKKGYGASSRIQRSSSRQTDPPIINDPVRIFQEVKTWTRSKLAKQPTKDCIPVEPAWPMPKQIEHEGTTILIARFKN
jgi:endonuclease YncB( thermonuclease family)